MNWNSWSDFVAMGGYGAYVWGSFGVAALAIVVECVAVARRRKALGSLPGDDDWQGEMR